MHRCTHILRTHFYRSFEPFSTTIRKFNYEIGEFFCLQLCNCNWPHITTTDKLFHFHLSWISLSFAVVLSQWRCHSVNEYILPMQRHKFSNYPFNLMFLIEFRIVNNTKSLSFDLLALLDSHYCECISHWWFTYSEKNTHHFEAAAKWKTQ